MAHRRSYKHRLDHAFIATLRPAYYPILNYTARPDDDFVRCTIAFERNVNVRLDIDSVLFHALDRAANTVASVPAILEVSVN